MIGENWYLKVKNNKQKKTVKNNNLSTYLVRSLKTSKILETGTQYINQFKA